MQLNRPSLTQYTHRKGPLHLFFATILFLALVVTPTHTTTFIMPLQNRSSSRLTHKRSASTATGSLQYTEQYDSMKVSELKAILKERGLAVSGVKSVLIERLNSSSSSDDALTAKAKPSSMSQPKAKRVRKKSTSSVEAKAKPSSIQQPKAKRARNKKSTPVKESIPQAPSVYYLPRTREMQLLKSKSKMFVIGVDEAGRGPLAGPVLLPQLLFRLILQV